MDRALGALSRALGLAHRVLPPGRPSGRSYFVTRLLREVVLGEAGLAGTNRRWERQRAWLHGGVIAASALVTVVALVWAWLQYADNAESLAAARPAVARLQAQASASQGRGARCRPEHDGAVARWPVVAGARRRCARQPSRRQPRPRSERQHRCGRAGRLSPRAARQPGAAPGQAARAATRRQRRRCAVRSLRGAEGLPDAVRRQPLRRRRTAQLSARRLGPERGAGGLGGGPQGPARAPRPPVGHRRGGCTGDGRCDSGCAHAPATEHGGAGAARAGAAAPGRCHSRQRARCRSKRPRWPPPTRCSRGPAACRSTAASGRCTRALRRRGCARACKTACASSRTKRLGCSARRPARPMRRHARAWSMPSRRSWRSSACVPGTALVFDLRLLPVSSLAARPSRRA